MTTELDALRLNFNPGTMIFLKIALGLIMLGVALDIKFDDLKSILKNPKSIFAGLVGQFLFLPFLTYLLILVIKPYPSVALGMILVAACPGGNFSNLFTLMAKGNTALSVSLTFLSTVFALFMTPFNISFWGKLYPPTAELVEKISLNPMEIAETVILILGVPLVIGLYIRHKNKNLADKIQMGLKKLSVIFVAVLIIGAFASNFKIFTHYIHYIVVIVFLQNLLALGAGFVTGTLLKIPFRDRRAITIEIGIQNSGLGLALAFEFFSSLGGVAFVCAWWGIWHALSGTIVVYLFNRKGSPQKVYES